MRRFHIYMAILASRVQAAHTRHHTSIRVLAIKQKCCFNFENAFVVELIFFHLRKKIMRSNVFLFTHSPHRRVECTCTLYVHDLEPELQTEKKRKRNECIEFHLWILLSIK